MSHPSLGLPARDPLSRFTAAGARLRANRRALAVRALEVARDRDPTLAARHDEVGLRNLLADAEAMVDRLALCVAGDHPHWLKTWADQAATVFRRRMVPMDDAIGLCEGLRAAAPSVLGTDEMAAADRALDEAVKVFRWYRRIAGDARRRNPILATLYKGG